MGKDKQRRASAAAQGSAQNSVGQVVDPTLALHKHAAGETPLQKAVPLKELRPSTVVHVGAEVQVTRDYLDMEVAPEDDGLAHCGYLVLKTGERLKILYVGSADTGDAGWLYGEVTVSLRPEPGGRRGWLPASAVESVPLPPPAPPPPGGAARTRAAAASAPARTPPKAPDPPPAPAQQKGRTPTAAPHGAPPAGASARPPGARVKPARAVPHSDEAFPALPGARSQDFSPTGLDRKGEPAPPVPEPDPQAKREAAAAAIARQRAAAAKAAAAAAAKKGGGGGSPGGVEQCPICMEAYTSAGRRRTQRPCCGGELCVQCDHKSLRSRRCYFCREDGDDFPDLSLACRVAA